MKKIFLVASAFMLSLAVMAQPKADDVAKFNQEKHDFGKIIVGTPVTYEFEIKNISDKPIVVESATASCGCTVPEKPVDPIMPGTSAKLKVQYNAAAASPFTKDIYVTFAGISPPKTVQITGEVLTAEAYEVWVKENKDKEKSKTSKTKPNN
jgi:Protein of unknown function (DUF1573)